MFVALSTFLAKKDCESFFTVYFFIWCLPWLRLKYNLMSLHIFSYFSSLRLFLSMNYFSWHERGHIITPFVHSAVLIVKDFVLVLCECNDFINLFSLMEVNNSSFSLYLRRKRAIHSFLWMTSLPLYSEKKWNKEIFKSSLPTLFFLLLLLLY